ncbi:hypothetical protein CVT25_008516 [Psilocybe cyanescens]|uniref:DUF6532 domain-containing protein n=1 Tax=Psilocybe cyanescens TaxID=93625 RepID=A0A409XNM8_PSICY|nr:hypothetical protein CVT25_008516 [Psilocybe cyanescens]
MNQEKLNEDEEENTDEPPSKRQRTSRNAVLSDDELEMVNTLTSFPLLQDEEPGEEVEIFEEDQGTGIRKDADDSDTGDADVEVISLDNNIGNEESNWMEGRFEDNGMLVVDEDAKSIVTSASKMFSCSSRSATPGAAGRITAGRSTKVTESDFSESVRNLAVAAKSHVQFALIYDTPFPSSNKLERMEFAWNVITETSKISGNTNFASALRDASSNPRVKKDIIAFTMYGRAALISNIITKARERVKAHYNLSGDPNTISEDVKWLLEKAHFIYGNLNIKVDHALKEWANGHKAINIPFSEDASKQMFVIIFCFYLLAVYV